MQRMLDINYIFPFMPKVYDWTWACLTFAPNANEPS